MVANVPFFSDKGDSNSSAGWKVKYHSVFLSIRKYENVEYFIVKCEVYFLVVAKFYFFATNLNI